MAEHLRAELVTAAGGPRWPRVAVHDGQHDLPLDRGSQYTSGAFADTLTSWDSQVDGRTGTCLGNAVKESFFAMLKAELCDRAHYAMRAETQAVVYQASGSPLGRTAGKDCPSPAAAIADRLPPVGAPAGGVVTMTRGQATARRTR